MHSYQEVARISVTSVAVARISVTSVAAKRRRGKVIESNTGSQAKSFTVRKFVADINVCNRGHQRVRGNSG